MIGKILDIDYDASTVTIQVRNKKYDPDKPELEPEYIEDVYAFNEKFVTQSGKVTTAKGWIICNKDRDGFKKGDKLRKVGEMVEFFYDINTGFDYRILKSIKLPDNEYSSKSKSKDSTSNFVKPTSVNLETRCAVIIALGARLEKIVKLLDKNNPDEYSAGIADFKQIVDTVTRDLR